jgi:hypothetical protein
LVVVIVVSVKNSGGGGGGGGGGVSAGGTGGEVATVAAAAGTAAINAHSLDAQLADVLHDVVVRNVGEVGRVVAISGVAEPGGNLRGDEQLLARWAARHAKHL